MRLKYFACWGIYDIDPFSNSFSFCRNPHMYFLKYCAIQQYCGEWVQTSLVILIEVSNCLGQWFSTLSVPQPIVATHYNPTTPS